MKLLHIDSSILGDHSASRTLSADLVAAERRLHPDLEVTYRDVAAAPFQHLTGAHLAASEAAPGIDAVEGAAALAEFLAADIIVIGAPMYNLTIPSQLKAWLDRLVVAGKTFRYTSAGAEGLAGGKKVQIASTRGGAYAGTPLESIDHQESLLRTVFGFLGITDITFFRAENLSRTELRDASLKQARDQIAELVAG